MRTMIVLLAAALAGCGVSETASVAATAGAAKAREAEQAQNAPAQVQGRVNEALQSAAKNREASEAR